MLDIFVKKSFKKDGKKVIIKNGNKQQSYIGKSIEKEKAKFVTSLPQCLKVLQRQRLRMKHKANQEHEVGFVLLKSGREL